MLTTTNARKAYKTSALILIIFLTGCIPKSYDRRNVNTAILSPVKADFVWPVEKKNFIKCGGKEGGASLRGLLISAKTGDSVVAARDGKVVFVDEGLRGYGKTIIIEHADNYSTVYTRSSEIFVKSGQWVRQGEPIGLVGSYGKYGAPEIYFEIRKNGRTEDPVHYLSGVNNSNSI